MLRVESLRPQNLPMPMHLQLCAREVDHSLLRWRADEDEAVGHFVLHLGSGSLLLAARHLICCGCRWLRVSHDALERVQFVADLRLLGALGTVENHVRVRQQDLIHLRPVGARFEKACAERLLL